jgi:site-specific DNA recombinase
VLEGMRSHLASADESSSSIADRDLIVQRVRAVTIKPRGVEVRVLPGYRPPSDNTCALEDLHPDSLPATVIMLPWTTSGFTAVKGILHSPSAAGPTLSSESRDALLGAIGKARRWINDLRHGRTASFEDIAKQEGQGERHIRLLALLAFVSPRIISAIVEGTAPAALTVTGLARALPYSWAEQERSVGLQ